MILVLVRTPMVYVIKFISLFDFFSNLLSMLLPALQFHVCFSVKKVKEVDPPINTKEVQSVMQLLSRAFPVLKETFPH